MLRDLLSPLCVTDAGQRPLGVHLWNDFAESSGNIENLEQLKAEVKKPWKSHFLISFFPNKFIIL